MRPKEVKKNIDMQKVDLLKKELSKEIKDTKIFLTLAREALGYNKSSFAKVIGVESTTISRWENGTIANPCLTWEQCLNLNNELGKIGFSIFDCPDLNVMVSIPDLKQLGLINKILQVT
jgi:DNA-binding XRE family transcriptional regulator